MNTQNIQAAGFAKKTYAQPQMKVYQVKVASIIATSPTSTSQNEEYEVESTDNWFGSGSSEVKGENSNLSDWNNSFDN